MRYRRGCLGWARQCTACSKIILKGGHFKKFESWHFAVVAKKPAANKPSLALHDWSLHKALEARHCGGNLMSTLTLCDPFG